MPVAVTAGVMADIAATEVGMLSKDMLPVTLREDTLVSVLAVDVLSILRGPRAATRALQDADVIGMAAATGEAAIGTVAVTGAATIGTRLMVILDWAMAIHTTRLAITVTATVGTMVRIMGTTLTATDIGGRP
jgi:hypothetical protein